MGDTYIHGYSQTEQKRLTLMQSILNEAELAALDVSGAQRILDVGCGLGQFTRALARAARPGARVLGVELDPRQLAEARRQAESDGEGLLAEFRQGSAFELPLTPKERGSFDLAHCRFLLEHVRDPPGVVREMCAAVRAGGRIVLIDDDHEVLRLWPPCETFERAWHAYWESYRDHGHDPLVGRRLPELLVQAGARPMRVTTVFYGAVCGGPGFDAVVDNLSGVLSGAALEVEKSARLPTGGMQAAIGALQVWRQLPAATLWYSLPLVEAVRER